MHNPSTWEKWRTYDNSAGLPDCNPAPALLLAEENTSKGLCHCRSGRAIPSAEEDAE